MSYHDNTERDYVLSVLAQNNSGVLLRIAGLFSRRCYNIKSIVAAQTEDAAHSQMIIVVQGDDRIVRQVDKQLSKLVEVEQVTVLNDDSAVVREHLLMKVERTAATTDHLMAIANVFHANVLNVTENNMIVELTGSAQTLNSFVECYKPYKIQKILRTGSMAMEK
ncbi:MAG: acetolactate synthase small subunit [Clostridiales bacterium]|jgi:acetolactate synthase-1/3 small subunit|nr:acetolactate synthase small subunit [Clostridiales bacterium]